MLFCSLGLYSCDEYDDAQLRDEIADLDSRVSVLEEWQKSVNQDISSLKTIVDALQDKNFITDVATFTENGKEAGYTITFSTGKTITSGTAMTVRTAKMVKTGRMVKTVRTAKTGRHRPSV